MEPSANSKLHQSPKLWHRSTGHQRHELREFNDAVSVEVRLCPQLIRGTHIEMHARQLQAIPKLVAIKISVAILINLSHTHTRIRAGKNTTAAIARWCAVPV